MLCGGIGGVELERFIVGLACQAGINVAEVFMRRGVGRVGANGHFQRGFGLVILLELGVNHGQIVVRLGKGRVLFGEFLENRNRRVSLAQFGECNAFEKA